MKSAERLSISLCLLVGFSCLPAVADTEATFQSSVSATFTLPSIANVDYDISPSLLSISTTALVNGNASLAYSSGPSVSWSNGVLSYRLSSATGSAGAYPPGGSILFEQGGTGLLTIANTNPYSIEIPFSASLTYMGDATATGGEAFAVSSAFLSVFNYSTSPDEIDILLGTVCGTGLGENSPANCLPAFVGESTPTSGTVTDTANMFVPADGTLVLELHAFTHDEASTIPEPGTLTLFGSGLLGIVGEANRKLRRG